MSFIALGKIDVEELRSKLIGAITQKKDASKNVEEFFIVQKMLLTRLILRVTKWIQWSNKKFPKSSDTVKIGTVHGASAMGNLKADTNAILLKQSVWKVVVEQFAIKKLGQYIKMISIVVGVSAMENSIKIAGATYHLNVASDIVEETISALSTLSNKKSDSLPHQQDKQKQLKRNKGL